MESDVECVSGLLTALELWQEDDRLFMASLVSHMKTMTANVASAKLAIENGTAFVPAELPPLHKRIVVGQTMTMDQGTARTPDWIQKLPRVSAGGPQIPKGASQVMGWVANEGVEELRLERIERRKTYAGAASMLRRPESIT